MFIPITLKLYKNASRGTLASDATSKEAVSNLLCTYINSVSKVTSYCLGVSQLNSPVFIETKEWLKDYQNILTGLKVEANIWKDSILGYMTMAPQTIVNYDKAFSLNAQTIIQLLTALKKEDSKDTREKLSQNIHSLLNNISTQEKMVNQAQTSLNDFQVKVTEGRKKLEQLMDFLTEDDKELKKKVKELSDDIADLQEESVKSSSWLTASEVSLGVSLAIGGVGLTLFLSPDPFSKITATILIACCIVGAGGTIASTVGIIMECEKNKELAKQIQEKTRELNNKNYDLSTLATAITNIKALEKSCNEAGNAMINIKLVWKDLYHELSELYNTIKDCDNPQDNKMITDAINELNTAQEQWNDIVKSAEIMATIEPVITEYQTINL